jgi:drug/metabolite transporter (DMT)-like permease
MIWLLRLYPAQWRERYGEEFGAILAGQRASPGLVLDVLGGAIDAHPYPQIQPSHSKQIKGDDTMTLEMLQRCAAGGPKLSPRDRRIASLFMISSGLLMAILYVVLTKIYHAAPAVDAVFYASFPFLGLVYGQAAYLRKRPWLTQAFILGGGLLGLYLFMLAACLIGSRL